MFALLFGQLDARQAFLAVVFALVLVERREHPDNHFARGRARIDAQVERTKMNAPAVELLLQLNRVHRVTAQPCQAIYHDDIPLAYGCQQLVKDGASGAGTRDLFLKDTRAPSPRQVVQLRIQVLVRCGNAGVAEEMLHGSESIAQKAKRQKLSEPTS